MSRIGVKPVVVPSEVTVVIQGNTAVVKGPKGELTQAIHPLVSLKQEQGSIVVSRKNDSKFARSLHGLTRALLANMVAGVVTEYTKKLELVGTGFRVTKKGAGLSMTLGFSHTVEVSTTAGVSFDVEGNTGITVRGANKHDVGQVAANIRRLKPPEPYKGKGIRYSDEHVRRKAGKQAKVGATA